MPVDVFVGILSELAMADSHGAILCPVRNNKQKREETRQKPEQERSSNLHCESVGEQRDSLGILCPQPLTSVSNLFQ